MDTLQEDQYIYLIMSRSVLLRMRNVSDKSCRENQNTQSRFKKCFQKIMLFTSSRGKLWTSQTAHRWQ